MPTPPSGQAAAYESAVVRAEGVTRLFDTRTSAEACLDAARGTRPASTIVAVCDAGTVAQLAPLTAVDVAERGEVFARVTVREGKNAGKGGWLSASYLAPSVEAAQQRQAAARAGGAYDEVAAALERACAKTKPVDNLTLAMLFCRAVAGDAERRPGCAAAVSERAACLEAFRDGKDAKARGPAEELLGYR